MNEDQFLILQSAVQFAADDNDAASHGERRGDMRWYQGSWFLGKTTGEMATANDMTYATVETVCGSTCCIAGNVAAQMGAKFILLTADYSLRDWEGISVNVSSCIPTGETVPVTIENYARRALGITNNEAANLFQGTLTLSGVIKRAHQIAKGYGYDLVITRKER